MAAEGALLADLDGAAELGDAVKPYGVDVERGVVADGAAGGVRRVGVGGGDGPGVGVMKEEVAVGTEWVCEGVALIEVLDAALGGAALEVVGREVGVAAGHHDDGGLLYSSGCGCGIIIMVGVKKKMTMLGAAEWVVGVGLLRGECLV